MTLGEKVIEVKIIEIEVEVETVVKIIIEKITRMTTDGTVILAETEVG